METKAIEQRCVCIRELLGSVNQGYLPLYEYLAEYLVLCQGIQHVGQDVVRTFSGEAAFTGVKCQKASVPLRLSVLQRCQEYFGVPFQIGMFLLVVSERFTRKAGTSQGSTREERCWPGKTKGTRSIPASRRL